jgi:hypothetical protein
MASFDINVIKTLAVSACVAGYSTAVEWAGRAVAVVKSGNEAALSYLQDKRIAAISVIAFSLILIEIGQGASYLLNRIGPNTTDRQKSVLRVVDAVAGLGILTGGIAFFVKHANLPLGWQTVTGITSATFFLRAFFEDTGSPVAVPAANPGIGSQRQPPFPKDPVGLIGMLGKSKRGHSQVLLEIDPIARTTDR